MRSSTSGNDPDCRPLLHAPGRRSPICSLTSHPSDPSPAIIRSNPPPRMHDFCSANAATPDKNRLGTMRPARSLHEWALSSIVEPVETGIAIGLQDAAETFQMLAGMLTLAIGRIPEEHGGWIGAARGPIVTHIGP